MLYPNEYLDSVKDISLEFLNKNNIKGLILDVDNTLINLERKMPAGVSEWAKNLKSNGIKMCILSNSNKIEKIEFEDDSSQKIDGVFIAQGTAGCLEFAKKLGAKTENNNIVVNDEMQTSIENIYACGDCTGGILQISKAVYEGTKAGLAIINKLRRKEN